MTCLLMCALLSIRLVDVRASSQWSISVPCLLLVGVGDRMDGFPLSF